MIRSEQSLLKARKFLEFLIQSGKFKKGDRLPTIKQLATSGRMSKDAIQAAVADLIKQGVLSAVRGSGIFLEPVSSPVVLEVTQQKWQRIYDAMTKDIVEKKNFAVRKPPALSDLQKRYKASYPTITKALRGLKDRNLLQRTGTHYHIPIPTAALSSASVLFISFGNQETIYQFNTRITEFISHAQHSCHEAGIQFVPCGIDEQAFDHIFNRLPPVNKPYGIIIYANGIPPTLANRLITHLSNHRVPLAIIDESEVPSDAQNRRTNTLCKIFTIDDESAGRCMGDYLINKGVRRAAWIASPESCGSSWAMRRYKGLVNAFNQAGFADGVIDINTTIISGPAMNRGGPTHLPQNTVSRFDVLNKIFNELKKISIVKYEHLITTAYQAEEIYAGEIQYSLLAPAIDRILQSGKIQACVGANDEATLFVNHHKKHNPKSGAENLFIAGFDNSRIAMEKTLTSYDFNIGALADRAVQFLINPNHDYFKQRPIIRHEGYVVERKSTRPLS